MASPEPNPEWWAGLPVWAQALGSFVFAVVMAALYKFGYQRREPVKEHEISRDVQVVAGAFADRQSLKELAMQIERTNDLIERWIEKQEHLATEADTRVEVERQIRSEHREDRMMELLRRFEEEKEKKQR